MVGVGGFFIMGGGIIPHTIPQVLGALSVLLAFVNVSGGFVITKRMLDMFKRRLPPSPLKDFSDNQQAQPTHPSIHGSMLFLVSSSLEDILLQQALAWPVLCKPAIWQAPFFVLDLYPGWLPKLPLVRGIFSAY
jgi:hypothetical protein